MNIVFIAQNGQPLGIIPLMPMPRETHLDFYEYFTGNKKPSHLTIAIWNKFNLNAEVIERLT